MILFFLVFSSLVSAWRYSLVWLGFRMLGTCLATDRRVAFLDSIVDSEYLIALLLWRFVYPCVSIQVQ